MGTRTEMKNLNSFKAIGRAIEYERRRQIELIEEGKRVIQETRRWDENKDATFAMRSKENAQDYRYFPEPDIPPVEISDDWYDMVKSSQPEMAEAKRLRYQTEYGLPEYDSSMITGEKAMADFFESTIALGADPKETANWIMGETMRILKDRAMETKDMPMTPEKLARVIELVKEGRLNRNMAREVYEALFDEDTGVDEYIKAHGMEQVTDENAIRESIAAILAENQKTVDEYKSGKTKVFGFLVGQTMRAMKGKADPAVINSILKELLES
jgi:aspartyl-tRNA(Asn)/glutamyl-tRNA(Gln) amidotransferase subunit B